MLKKIVSFFASGLLAVSCAAAVVNSDNCNLRSYAAGVDTSAYERVMDALEKGAEVAADQVKITLNDAGKTYAKVTFTLMNGDEIIGSKKLDGSGVGTSTFKNLPMNTNMTLKITVPNGFEVDGKSGVFTVGVTGGKSYSFSIVKVVVPTEPPTTKPAPTQAPTTKPEPTTAKPVPTEAPTTKPEPTKAPETKPEPTEAPATEAATEAEEAPDTDPAVINTTAESETTTTTAVTGKNLGSDGGKKDTSTSAKKNPSAASATKKTEVKVPSSNTGVQAPTVVFGALGGCAVIAAICLIGRKKSDDDEE